MDYYGLFTLLVGARDGNLPPYKDARLKRYKSVQKVMELMVTASKLAPSFPVRAITLDPLDPEWDDIMPFPVMDYTNYALFGLGVLGNFWFYAYNYNTLTANFRFRNVRYFFPVVNALLIGRAFYKYNNNLLRVNLFDEYNWLRAQELVQQNEYLLKHEGTHSPHSDFKRFIWWTEDFAETLNRVHRQANDHEATDFKDSEIVLQDFIDRYVDPAHKNPLKKFALVGF